MIDIALQYYQSSSIKRLEKGKHIFSKNNGLFGIMCQWRNKEIVKEKNKFLKVFENIDQKN